MSKKTAQLVAQELTDHDALRAHLDAELGIYENQLTNPWHAALSSALSFLAGAALPMAAIALTPGDARLPVTFLASLVALAITGAAGAYLGNSRPLRPVLRVTLGGGLALALTWAIGHLLCAGVAL